MGFNKDPSKIGVNQISAVEIFYIIKTSLHPLNTFCWITHEEVLWIYKSLWILICTKSDVKDIITNMVQKSLHLASWYKVRIFSNNSISCRWKLIKFDLSNIRHLPTLQIWCFRNSSCALIQKTDGHELGCIQIGMSINCISVRWSV